MPALSSQSGNSLPSSRPSTPSSLQAHRRPNTALTTHVQHLQDHLAATKNTVVFGIFPNRPSIESATNRLAASGFRTGDFSVVLANLTRPTADVESAPATGITVGGTFNENLQTLRAFSIPGVGSLQATGPLLATFTGLGLGGAPGGLVGALSSLGIPDYEACRYEGRIGNGAILLAVHCETAQDVCSAQDILRNAGAEDIAATRQRQTNTESDLVSSPTRIDISSGEVSHQRTGAVERSTSRTTYY